MQQNYSHIIKQKADFIMNNSGLLVYKLKDNLSRVETLNNLTLILLSSSPIEDKDLTNAVNELLAGNHSYVNKYADSYHNALCVIFTLCSYVNKVITKEDQRMKILDILRKYPQKFSYNEKTDLKLNNRFINFNDEEYQKIKKNLK